MTSTEQVNIVSAEFKANPFPFLATLRASEPVFRTTLPDKAKTAVWLITRYADVNALLKDERFPKNRLNALTPEQIRKLPWVPPMFRPLEHNMLDLDAPDYTRLRALVHKAFTPRLVEQMRARVQSMADGLLDGITRHDEMDLINDYALPLPTRSSLKSLVYPQVTVINFTSGRRPWCHSALRTPRCASSRAFGCSFATCAAFSKYAGEIRRMIWPPRSYRQKKPGTS